MVAHDEVHGILVHDMWACVNGRIHVPFGIRRAQDPDALDVVEILTQIQPLILLTYAADGTRV
jgi:hypothetical protein